MSPAKPITTFTVDQYLAMERAADERHEYLDGEVFAMAGEATPYGFISTNLVISLGTQLKKSPCGVLTKDTKVRSGPSPRGLNSRKGLYSYPDVIVVFGEPEYHDAEKDVILNPKVIIEVLSPSTEAFDRGEKSNRYQSWNDSLTDYLLVAQDQMLVEHYSRQPKGAWLLRRYEGRKAVVPIPSIGCKLKLVDVYDRIKFK